MDWSEARNIISNYGESYQIGKTGVAFIQVITILVASFLLLASLNRKGWDLWSKLPRCTRPFSIPVTKFASCLNYKIVKCGMGSSLRADSENIQVDKDTVEELSLAMVSKASMFDLLPPLSPEQDANADWLMEVALLGRVVSEAPISMDHVINATKSWPLAEIVYVSYLGFNIFQFEFGSTEDRQMIWENRPWSMAGHQLVLRPWKDDFSTINHDLNITVLWLQAKGLQPKFNNRSTVLKICQRMEVELLEVDIPEGVNLSQLPYLRFKVSWDTRNPIVVGLPYPQSAGEVGWIVLQYERVSIFCFTCGRLGHEPRNCHFIPVMVPFPTCLVPLRDVAFDAKAPPKHAPPHIKVLIPATTLRILYPDTHGVPSQPRRALHYATKDHRNIRENQLQIQSEHANNTGGINQSDLQRNKGKQVVFDSMETAQHDQSQSFLFSHVGCSNLKEVQANNNGWWQGQSSGQLHMDTGGNMSF